jgi:alpha-galactosidase
VTQIVEHAGVWHLRSAGTSVLVDASGLGSPAVVHWGADLGEGLDLVATVAGLRAPPRRDLDDRADASVVLVPLPHGGYPGRPGLSMSVSGRGEPTLLLVEVLPFEDGIVFVCNGWDHDLVLRTTLRLDDAGVVMLRHVLTNRGPSELSLAELNLVLPLPPNADEIIDTTGRWAKEQQPQRRHLDFGAWVRSSRRGRPGHDSTLVLLAGVGPVRNRSAECWGVHLGWSGDRDSWVERSQTFAPVIGAGELLQPGEVVLGTGESYGTPWLYAAYSGRGLDGISAAMHHHLRLRPTHPVSPRPVTLNTWEAVYFDGDLINLSALAERAAEVGVERYVLDDGWFRGRRDDTAGLGDWFVDEKRWPHGLHPLVDHVKAAGLEFGLWVEPEMVNADSDLFREHPDWALRVDGELPTAWRNQYALDLQNPDVFGYLLERLTSLVAEYEVGYLKWDHNRDVFGVSHGGRPAMHGQTLALYRLLDAVKADHPALEIESCSSGGARIDLGILARTDRVWTSDTIDALERVSIQRWTSLLLPPELMGAHIGGPSSHTTGRRHDLSFRFAVALLGHLGIEWDLTTVSPEELAAVASCVAFSKRWRPLIHTGYVVNADVPFPSATLTGVVSKDATEGLFVYAQLVGAEQESPTRVLLPGLRSDLTYRLEVHTPAGDGPPRARVLPDWIEATSPALSGAVLTSVGLPLPALLPEQALIFSVVAGSRNV